jgi:hypothetical protein
MENRILCGSSWRYVAGVIFCKVSRQPFIRWNDIRSLLVHIDCVPRLICCVSCSKLSWKLTTLQAVKYHCVNSYSLSTQVISHVRHSGRSTEFDSPVYVFVSQIMHSETSTWSQIYMNTLASGIFYLFYERTEDNALSSSAESCCSCSPKKWWDGVWKRRDIVTKIWYEACDCSSVLTWRVKTLLTLWR